MGKLVEGVLYALKSYFEGISYRHVNLEITIVKGNLKGFLPCLIWTRA